MSKSRSKLLFVAKLRVVRTEEITQLIRFWWMSTVKTSTPFSPTYQNYVLSPLQSPIPATHVHTRSQLEVHFNHLCYSRAGFIFQIVLNVFFIALNVFLIVYEHVVSTSSEVNTLWWYVALDILLVAALVIEVCVRQIQFGCSFRRYFALLENKFDVFITVFSCACLVLYVWDFNRQDGTVTAEAQTVITVARIVRDVVRIVRILFFAKALFHSFVDFRELERNNESERDPFATQLALCPNICIDTPIVSH